MLNVNFWLARASDSVGTGEVLRFDQVRGYGFIAPSGGGADIFLHMNDILEEKHRIVPGTLVEFEVEEGQRGPKASSVRIVRQPSGATPAPVRREPAVSGDGDSLCDILSPGEFTHEVTELLLSAEPSLTASQIVQVRSALVQFARKSDWVED
jgi:cold shock CspA family protein